VKSSRGRPFVDKARRFLLSASSASQSAVSTACLCSLPRCWAVKSVAHPAAEAKKSILLNLRILNDGFAPTGADNHQSCRAIVEHPGQDQANHPAAIGGSRGTKQRSMAGRCRFSRGPCSTRYKPSSTIMWKPGEQYKPCRAVSGPRRGDGKQAYCPAFQNTGQHTARMVRRMKNDQECSLHIARHCAQYLF
jgi:hypothetical protein